MTEITSPDVTPAPGASASARVAARILGAAAFVLYPVLVGYGLSLGEPRRVSAWLLCLFAPLALMGLSRARARVARSLVVVPFVTLGALALGTILDHSGFVLAVPAAINAVLLLAFAATLRRGSTPMIERFARLQSPELTLDQLRWCRAWTCGWCAFFVVNGGIAASLALWAPVKAWTIYNGFVAYLAIGTMLGVEWILRRRRFGPTIDGTTRRA